MVFGRSSLVVVMLLSTVFGCAGRRHVNGPDFEVWDFKYGRIESASGDWVLKAQADGRLDNRELSCEVVKRQTMDNPVYYVQYGHARIASILRKAEADGVTMRPIDAVDLSMLSSEAEMDLLRSLADLPAQIGLAASQRAPHRLTHAAQELAARFHHFYTECRVVSQDAALTQARLWLCAGTKQAIGNLLGLIGVSAHE